MTTQQRAESRRDYAEVGEYMLNLIAFDYTKQTLNKDVGNPFKDYCYTKGQKVLLGRIAKKVGKEVDWGDYIRAMQLILLQAAINLHFHHTEIGARDPDTKKASSHVTGILEALVKLENLTLDKLKIIASEEERDISRIVPFSTP